MKALSIIVFVIFCFGFVGCEEDCVSCVNEAPATPTGVYSITGDDFVYIEWYPVEDDDLRQYRIWWSSDDSLYELMDSTTETFYYDSEVDNGPRTE